MQDLIDRHFTITIIAILCIVEMAFTGQGPDTGWLFVGYGAYKIFMYLLEE